MYYYWSIWFIWIVVTFIMEKNQLRTILAVCLFIHIIVSHHIISIMQLEMNGAFILTFLYACVAFAKRVQKNTLITLLQLFSMVFAYAFFMIFALYDPIWFTLIKSEWIVFGLLMVMAMAYGYNLTARLTLFVLAMCLGEGLYALSIHMLTSVVVIGDMPWLAQAMQGVIFLVGVSQLELLLKNYRSSRKPVKGAVKSS
ncbi:YphA family membrane protein [Bacillus sp. NPDC077027]|uniref:YphA family membrane protein n=1 Tax=Bacillus sp. NPDC077027 TaxID=3390548 RepID=UPI003D0796A0